MKSTIYWNLLLISLWSCTSGNKHDNEGEAVSFSGESFYKRRLTNFVESNEVVSLSKDYKTFNIILLQGNECQCNPSNTEKILDLSLKPVMTFIFTVSDSIYADLNGTKINNKVLSSKKAEALGIDFVEDLLIRVRNGKVAGYSIIEND